MTLQSPIGQPSEDKVSRFCVALEDAGFSGDLNQSAATRQVMATDNSIYHLEPTAVLYPRGTADLQIIAELMARTEFSDIRVAPRGGGTGTNGQSLTNGVMVDLSRHMNQIIEIDIKNRTARVQGGVVKDQLNAALEKHGLFFAPELSTSNRATIGGMISTDASGQGSCIYGKTRDHILATHMVLSDGSLAEIAPVDDNGLAALRASGTKHGQIAAQLDTLYEREREQIAAIFPKLNRCLTGYDLAHLRRDDGMFDLNAVICGSEGTLGFIAEATVNLMPIPRHVALLVVQYNSFDAALRDAQNLVVHAPASIETIDSHVLNLARGDQIWQHVAAFFPARDGVKADGINIIEVIGDTREDLEHKLDALGQDLADTSKANRIGFSPVHGSDDIVKLWEMRKRAVGLLGNMSGPRRPVAFVEDTAVPPEKLADYILEFRALLDSYGLVYGMFGHVDAGVLHVRPAIDISDPNSIAMVRDITERVVALTKKYGGLLWGEHGKGVRSEFSPEFFGPLYPALQAVKVAFDPNNQFNSGKIAAPETETLLAIDQVPTRGARIADIPSDMRDNWNNATYCNGNGACFNWDPDQAMCPSWKSTRDRVQSPKGRAQLLREWVRRETKAGRHLDAEMRQLRSGSWIRRSVTRMRNLVGAPKDGFAQEVNASMQTCLACKSCTTGCPVKVDVPSFRSKFLELHYARHIRPIRHHMIASLEALLPVMSATRSLTNLIMASGMLKLFGLTALPQLNKINIRAELRGRGVKIATPEQIHKAKSETSTTQIVLVVDPFTRYFDAPVLLDSIDLLQALGYHVWLAPRVRFGKALHVLGFLRRFQRTAEKTTKRLSALREAGAALVGIDPSMTLSLTHDYRGYVRDASLEHVEMIQDWLMKQPPLDCSDLPKMRHILLPHCTGKALAPASVKNWQLLYERFGQHLDVQQVGCCGMAGTFGHETANRTLSENIYALSWADKLASITQSSVVADGFSCRCQAKEIDNAAISHPIQPLRRLLDAKAHTLHI